MSGNTKVLLFFRTSKFKTWKTQKKRMFAKMLNVRRGGRYINNLKLSSNSNNSERPVDALAVKTSITYLLTTWNQEMLAHLKISLDRQRTNEQCRLLSLQEGRELEIDKGRKPSPGEKYSRQLKVNKMWLLDSTLPYVIQQNIKPGLAKKVLDLTKII